MILRFPTHGEVGLYHRLVFAETVQDRVGAWFGISGGVVVLIVLFALWAAASNKKPEPVEVMTQHCADGKHNVCSGNARLADSQIKPCECTCHGAFSDNCKSKNRHDLCSGCRCTCHLPRS